MASENKKKKAVNSYIHNGGEKLSVEDWKCKRICYFTKRDRNLNKKKAQKEIDEYIC